MVFLDNLPQKANGSRLIGESIDALVGWKWYHHGAPLSDVDVADASLASLIFDVVFC